MRHIYKGLALCTAFAFGSTHAFAQGADPALDTMGDSTKVQVAFRTADQQDLLGGISVINVADLSKKAYTTGSLNFVENVVGGVNGNIWGMTEYLVVIDGIVRDANNVLPSEIDQITILKGASAVVLYGSRASKGVIQITTKRGKVGDTRVYITANTGLHTPKRYPKYLGAAEYMTLYNEARANDNAGAGFSAEQIYHTAQGTNPYRYPDLDMYSSDFLRKVYNRTEAVAEITGGNERVKFYTTGGYLRESSLLKVGNAADNYVSRFFVRGNIDMKLHDLITAQADANVTFYDSYSAAGNWWGDATTLRPHRVAPLIPLSYLEENDVPSWNTINNSNNIVDGKYFLGGTQQDPTNPIAAAYAGGDSKYVSRQYQFNTRFDINLSPVLNGLFFRAKYGIDYATTYSQGYSNEYATFAPSWTNYAGADKIASITQYGNDRKSGVENISGSSYRFTYNVSAQFDYTKTINEDHNLFGMLVGNVWQRQVNGEYHRTTNANLGFQASYNYKHKYYADLSVALPYSAKMPSGNRLGFSPTLTLGWRPVKEDFFKNTAFDDLMITASAGIIAQDLDITTDDNAMGYNLYLAQILHGNGVTGWYGWGDNGGGPITQFSKSNNPNLTFVKRKEITVGLRGSLWEKTLTFDMNFFMNRMDGDIVQPRSLYPNYFEQIGYPVSNILPWLNFNIDDRMGMDFSVYFNKRAGEVDFTVGLSGMYYSAKAKKRDEIYAPNEQYRSRAGQQINSLWGLESMGFFNSQAEIDKAPRQTFATAQPGDLRYKDQNGDNKIDENDEVYLGRWDTPMRLGINLTAQWRDFSVFAMLDGYFGGYGMKDSSYWWASGEGKYSEAVRGRWTPETKNNASYPRLTTSNGANNFRYSDFWMYKTARMSLSQVQVTYNLPQAWFESKFVRGLSVYLSGYNLLTLGAERKITELNVGSAPQTRFYNLGVKATF
ncbi:MAG: SusC/RagA family TonB-linked outer membrane protein [Mediterranea sp.]|jgi:TonB-linked SusC/RagA family outer membrane protein|nr:SusC/RagA family TonB-linked outer membrane protein [Mediterranea sp.]